MISLRRLFILFIVCFSLLLSGCRKDNEQPDEQPNDNPTEYVPEFSGGSGTLEAPYIVKTAKDFYDIRFKNNAHFILESDIDFKNFTYEDENSNSVIGYNPIEIFSGTLNGNGYKVFNVSYGNHSYNRMGLFQVIKNATIKNLMVRTCDFNQNSNIQDYKDTTDTENYFGFLAAESIDSTISCVKIIGFGSNVNIELRDTTSFGLIVGVNKGTIKDCQLELEFNLYTKDSTDSETSKLYSGGISGINYGVITDCTSYSRINTLDNYGFTLYVGGITGLNEGQIIKTSCGGAVNSENRTKNRPNYAGGIAGISTVGSLIINSYTYNFIGSIGEVIYVGGIVGYNEGEFEYVYSNSGIFDNGIPTGSLVGAILGYGKSVDCTNCYYMGVLTNAYGSEADSNGLKLNPDQALNPFSYNGWDFMNTWTIINNVPKLRLNEALWVYSTTSPFPSLRKFL